MLLLSICGVVRQHGKMHRINNQIYEWLICEKILEYNLIKDTTMKIKLLASSIVMAGALMASGSASAQTFEWSGTMTDWAGAAYNGTDYTGPVSGSILDSNVSLTPNTGTVTVAGGDGDTTFTLINNTTPGATGVKLSEQENAAGVDLYGVNVSFGVSATSGYYGYSISTTDPEGLNAGRLGVTTQVGIGDVTKYLYSSQTDYQNAVTSLNYSVNDILFLHSTNEISDPAIGLASFPDQTTFWALDVINSGAVNNINNQYTIYSAPEPMTMAMMGLGFAAFGYSRRRKAA
jgi:hypothetical protein